MTIKNGDLPAMPVCYDARMMAAYSKGDAMGLSKREQFAAMAMQGLSSESGRYQYPSEMAHDAVKLADALLAELERTGKMLPMAVLDESHKQPLKQERDV